MFQQKFGAKAKRYLEDLRRAAMIEYKTTDTRTTDTKTTESK